MTESTPSDNFSKNKDLDPSVARVFFEESTDWMDFHVVQPTRVSMRTDAGRVLFDTLAMATGEVLAPAIYLDESGEDKVLVQLGRELEPVNNIVNGHYYESPFLRTRDPGDNMRFVDATRMLGSDSEAFDMHEGQSRDEWQEAERYYQVLHHVLDPLQNRWLRLEAAPGADEHLLGKTMIARLFIFMTQFRYDGTPIDERGLPGVFPMVFDHRERRMHFIPEQLMLADPWLYIELDKDPEDKEL